MSKHTERAFEKAIEVGLIACGGYTKLAPENYDKARALFPEDVIGFLKDTQAARWGQLETTLRTRTEETVLDSLVKELAMKGTLYVLRYGFMCYGKTLRLAYPRPNTSMNPEAQARYDKHRLGISRQVAFTSVMKKADGKNRRCVIDVVLTVNGLPVVTAELKNPLTGQCAADAKVQYMQDRDGRDLLFKFKERALVHFAVDPDEVWMTTQLKDKETVFLPFNKGDRHGVGNPPIEDNWRTHYLWDEVLTGDSILDILQRFMHLEVKKRKIVTDKGVRTVRKETMIFPRYHQLDAVRRLVGHARVHGAGHNYLIQHSAGSGKSNSIAWLAHRLSNLHNEQDQKVFHSVVVISDRRVLDQQLQNTIYQFDHKKGVVEQIDEDTQQLAKALSDGTPIVISTIQKFPFISQALSTLEKKGKGIEIDTRGKRYAVIVDEAHSSQSGETATTLRGVLNKSGIEEAIAAQIGDEEDDDLTEDAKAQVIRDMLKRARQPNLSFFAFTATPKFKTKAVFDEPGPSGLSPFHEYTMRQAIEEGFILDVLENYTYYKRFYGLLKQAESDPMVSRKQAVKALGRYMELHPVNIEQVVTVIIEHFRINVMHELGGRAKAMVVTGSREAAVRYKLAFDAYIKKQGYLGIKSLVAFSGSLELDDMPGLVFTEVGMNSGLSESELPERFEGGEYRVLLVAEKYQTGFNQPLLQTMYVVKKLAGVQAVQTLSRLNRIAPGKTRTFVLDFVNEEIDIFDAFKPYYETTPVGENADPQQLNGLQHKILEPGIVTPEDVSDFAQVWYRRRREHSRSDHRTMNAVLDRIVERFKELEESDREQYRGVLTAFRNLYAFLSQVIPYQDSELEKLCTLVRNLLTKLPRDDSGEHFHLDDEVTLKYFRMRQIGEGSIDLSKGEAEPLKGPTDVGTAQVKDEEVELSSLVEKLNERFGTDFTEADQLFFDQVSSIAENKEKITEAALANTFENFSSYFERVLEELFIERMDGNEDIFNHVMSDTTFRGMAHDHIARQVWERIRALHEAKAKEREEAYVEG